MASKAVACSVRPYDIDKEQPYERYHVRSCKQSGIMDPPAVRTRKQLCARLVLQKSFNGINASEELQGFSCQSG